MDWEAVQQACERNFAPVSGGFTTAKRGIVKIDDGISVYVKIATDHQTQTWLEQELHAYRWLEAQGYVYIPKLISFGADGFALTDLSLRDWGSRWSNAKVEAALRAMDELAKLSVLAKDEFLCNDFGESLWRDLPKDTTYSHIPNLPASLHHRAKDILNNERVRNNYHELAARNPNQGSELVHGDVRADNFAYDVGSEEGVLVDWNWLSLGSKKFDQTALLVDIQKNFDVFPSYAARLDSASLAWLVGFWLKQATIVPDSYRMGTLRLFQLESAIRAHDMLLQLQSMY